MAIAVAGLPLAVATAPAHGYDRLLKPHITVRGADSTLIFRVRVLQWNTHRLERRARVARTKIGRPIHQVPREKRAGKVRYWTRKLRQAQRLHLRVPRHPWGRLASCESGRDWHYNGSSGFDGGLQFLPSTWRKAISPRFLDYPLYAYQATPRMQYLVAADWLARTSWRQWPACSRRLGLR